MTSGGSMLHSVTSSLSSRSENQPEPLNYPPSAAPRVTSAKYLSVQLTENLHWGKHSQATKVKANSHCKESKSTAFIYRNL